MAKAKKFGAFSGVFTPSILTILGVIMYMRLGWVVGEAGLFYTIAIILIAHIISVSTGLSISSIATDKKIKTGGIYYMLSRSLGFPMGGSIGITIFVGTALSISLYIIGFAESFLGIESIRNFLHLKTDINSYRILGTGVIIFLVLIAFISTSLAIKTQFYILIAIILSIVSIFVGFFINTDLAPKEVLLYPKENGESLEFIFAIFFPAVTGFTAGVAMSGDLKDPKKTIPIGTIFSIIIGFIVYMSLAISFAYFVNRDLLLEDVNFLNKVAWFSPMVIAGIWGATLSSALGGILGAPRILQAISKDKITPKIFSIGYGKNNEPRNALIFTFLIAELGILIGELNLIAGIVSMFYLAAYGFINLSYALESWASSDFLPSLKISKFIGIIGAIVCFGVMFKLDMISMILSFIIMGMIYFYLQRKQMKSEFGDVWQSVWNTVIRTALHKVQKNNLEKRNWQANAILFSGELQKKRPYLIEFGKFLVGKHGMLSNFDIIESEKETFLFQKNEQNLKKENPLEGIFSRKISCTNIYEGMKTVAGTYGFSGIEPNTVILGWLQKEERAKSFISLIANFSNLDLSILMLNYSIKRGFGKYKRIDLWWRGAGNNGNFALTLIRFILLSHKWVDAKLRLLIINNKNQERETIYKSTKRVLDNFRIEAEIRIINNEIEKRTFEEIIKIESLYTDLTFLGIGEIENNKEKIFFDNTNKIIKNIGTVVLIKASSYFKELQVTQKEKNKNFKDLKKESVSKIDNILLEKIKSDNIIFPKNNIVKSHLSSLRADFKKMAEYFYKDYFAAILKYKSSYQNILIKLIYKTLNNANFVLKKEKSVQQKYFFRIQDNFLKGSQKLIDQTINEAIENQKNILEEATKFFLSELEKKVNNSVKIIFNNISLDDLKKDEKDNFSLIYFKFFEKIKIKISGHPTKYQIKFQKLLKSYIPYEVYNILFKILNEFGMISVHHIFEFQKIVKSVKISLFTLEIASNKNLLDEKSVKKEKDKISNELRNLMKITPRAQIKIYHLLMNELNFLIQKISNDLQTINPNSLIKRKHNDIKRPKDLLNLPNIWKKNQILFYNSTSLELNFYLFENKLKKISRQTLNRIEKTFDVSIIENFESLKKYLIFYKKNLISHKNPKFNFSRKSYDHKNYFFKFLEIIDNTFEDIKNEIKYFPKFVEVMDNNSYFNFEKLQFKKDGIKTIKIQCSRMLDYLIQNDLIEPLQKNLEKLSNKLRFYNSVFDNLILQIYEDTEIGEEENIIMNGEIENLILIVRSKEKVISETIENILQIREEINLEIKKIFNDIFEKLTIHKFNNEERNLDNFEEENSKKIFSYKRIEFFKNLFFLQMEKIYYRKSDGILLANKFKKMKSIKKTSVDEVLNLLEKVSPDPILIKKLPFYYKQLFSNKHQYDSEIFIGRKEELLEADIAYKRYLSNFQGGIMITGEHNSGKTFFSQFIANKFIQNGSKIYEIETSDKRNIDIKFFKKTLENKLNSYGSYQEIFNRIPENSIIIFDNLELWWQKTEDGFEVIDLIINLIEKFSNKCLFIVNVNHHTLKLMNKIKNVENYFLKIIECKPFNAMELKEIILLRHRLSPIRFSLKKKHENNFNEIDYANLFSKYFNYSDGNIGTSLQAWRTNIKDFKNGILQISYPKNVDLFSLENLSSDIYVLILQFILHKKLDMKTIEKINFNKKNEIEKQINYLKRIGIIQENSNKSLFINQYLYHFIKKIMIEKEIL